MAYKPHLEIDLARVRSALPESVRRAVERALSNAKDDLYRFRLERKRAQQTIDEGLARESEWQNAIEEMEAFLKRSEEVTCEPSPERNLTDHAPGLPPSRGWKPNPAVSRPPSRNG